MSEQLLRLFSVVFLVFVAVSVNGQPPAPRDAAARQEAQRRQDAIADTPGSGPFPALKELDPGLPGQVVYRPEDLTPFGESKLGVYVFGNGGCSDDAASSRLHLLEVASHGYIVVAPGGIYSGPGKLERSAGSSGIDTTALPTRAEQLREAVDWVLEENGRSASRYAGRVDPGAIAVSGFSCGGLQALSISDDPRISTAVIMNSGLFIDEETRMGGMSASKDLLADLHFPTLYILGGPTDIAYENGMDDYSRIDHVPVAVADIDRGHGGTYWEPNGGAAAEVVVKWLNWQLRGDVAAKDVFVGADCDLCVDPQWTLETKQFELL